MVQFILLGSIIQENQSINIEGSNLYQEMEERPIKGMNQNQQFEEYGESDPHPQTMKRTIKQPKAAPQSRQLVNNALVDDDRPLTGTNKDFQ